MSRFFKKITLEEFKKKFDPIINPEDEDGSFPYEMPPTIAKDIKVSFDFENWEAGDAQSSYSPRYARAKDDTDYPEGYDVLPNGMPCVFIWAGGDWEFPVSFVIYFDGSKLRGYVPTQGNLWNRRTKSAFGNEYEFDGGEDTLYQVYKDLITEAKEWAFPDLITELFEKLESAKADDRLLDFYDSLNNLCSAKAIKNDIMSRIIEK